ncbi:MAG TPA: hypothetical protein VNI83_09365, partial [Vicinamibacterales bacterium]|nr:hypothetical protein [Vicinamibacterales bacterium]
MIERFGQERLLASLDAERVSQDDYGELYRLPLEGDEPIVMVRLVCPSTGRVYFERVPPDMERPRQALAWQAQVTESEYVLAAES